MKTKISIISLIIILFSAINIHAQPDWAIESTDYQYSMSVTTEIQINGEISHNPLDILAAFVNNECRGIGNPVYVEALDKYIVFLMIYSNTVTEDNITFKAYSNSTNSEVDFSKTINFESNKVFGTPDYPCIISNPALNIETNILSFYMSDQVKECVIDLDTKTVIGFMPSGTPLSGLAASFTLSVGATAFIDNKLQESSLTSNDFSSPLNYTILSEDRFENSEWIIEITISSGLETVNKTDRKFNVYPNPTNGIINIIKLDANQSFNLTVYNIIGEEVYKITDTYMPVKIDMSDYPAGIYLLGLSNPNLYELHKIIVK